MEAILCLFPGSVLFIFEPIGSVLSAVVTDYLGRRRAMMLVNIPYAVAWLMMFNASSILEIFIANSLLGFGIGLMESSIMYDNFFSFQSFHFFFGF